jgi:DhnA family fructose-bisphosphate aldolase class Ia
MFTELEMTGLDIRMKRFFRNGPLLLAAFDHGQYVGVPEGLADVARTVGALRGLSLDGYILNAGIVPRIEELDESKLIVVRSTHAGTKLSETARINRYFLEPEDALRLGADAVISMVVLGHDGDVESLGELTKAVRDYHRFGIPVIAEALPADPSLMTSPKAIADISRICAELGADVVKTAFTRDFESVVASCPVPVIIAGGSKGEDFLGTVAQAMRAGAKGLAMGRNLYQREDQRAFVEEVARTMGKGAPRA